MPILSLTPEVHVFPCPHCGETINTSASQCPFCAAPIDAASAEAAAAETSHISGAVSDASYLKILLGMLLFFAVTLIVPFLGLAGLLGLAFIKYAVPVMAARWWVKYGRIKTTDPDFAKARKIAIWVSALSVVSLLFLRIHLFTLTL